MKKFCTQLGNNLEDKIYPRVGCIVTGDKTYSSPPSLHSKPLCKTVADPIDFNRPKSMRSLQLSWVAGEAANYPPRHETCVAPKIERSETQFPLLSSVCQRIFFSPFDDGRKEEGRVVSARIFPFYI